jgi:choline dehydrogenase-like flavoprotein
MLPFFQACERDVSVTALPEGRAPAASLKLLEGARKLGWKSMEVPRWFKYEESSPASEAPAGTRQSMTQTFLPRALRAGAQLLPGHRATTLRFGQGRWRVEGVGAKEIPFVLEAETVFVCAGATQTPALLRRSGITRQIGDALQMHPTIKAVGLFPEPVNLKNMGVPAHQVKEFADISLGCSISTPPFLRLGLLDHPAWADQAAEAWRHLAVYYAMIVPEGRGTVRNLPGFRDALVRYQLTPRDLRRLGEAARKLCEVLLAAGASAVYPAIRRSQPITGRDGLFSLPNQLATGSPGLMTIHLFSSCPMGEREDRCAVDSFGRVHGLKNLHVADASLLCTAPGVNPQGTIMALARRNALHFLGKN